jgi:hypothetical protein
LHHIKQQEKWQFCIFQCLHFYIKRQDNRRLYTEW